MGSKYNFLLYNKEPIILPQKRSMFKEIIQYWMILFVLGCTLCVVPHQFRSTSYEACQNVKSTSFAARYCFEPASRAERHRFEPRSCCNFFDVDTIYLLIPLLLSSYSVLFFCLLV